MTVTEVALVADTVRVVEPPALIEAGLAETVTAGFSAGGGVLEALPEPPHPDSPSRTGTAKTRANFIIQPGKTGYSRAFIGKFPSFCELCKLLCAVTNRGGKELRVPFA